MPLRALSSYEFLGSLRLAGAAASSGVLAIPTRDQLLVSWYFGAVSGSAHVGLQFNGDTTAANYRSRSVGFSAAATPVLSGSDWSGDPAIILHASNLTDNRRGYAVISNLAAAHKLAVIRSEIMPTTAARVAMVLAWGQWFNAAAQISSIEMIVSGGFTMAADSMFAVYGRNL